MNTVNPVFFYNPGKETPESREACDRVKVLIISKNIGIPFVPSMGGRYSDPLTSWMGSGIMLLSFLAGNSIILKNGKIR
jgi:hypothetical protein